MYILLVSASFCILSGLQETGGSTSRGEQLQSLKRKVESIRAKYAAALPATNDEERDTSRTRYREEMQPCIAQALQLAQECPRDRVTFEALEWIATGLPYFDETWTALDLLKRDYARDKRIALVCSRAVSYRIVYGGTEDFLRDVLANNPHRQARGVATFTLAGVLRDYAHLAKFSRNPANAGWEKEYPNELVEKIKQSDPEKVLKQAEAFYRETIKQYSDIKLPGRSLTLDRYAKASLFEQFLQIGKLAPDTEGEDLDGINFKLSDYRGKVVLLVFWASWCAPCMAAVPQERELVKRFKGRPFVLIGVNGDDKKDNALKAVKKKDIPWRSFWNGKDGADGKIAMTWSVQGWPTVYLLDANGVIRQKNPNLSTLPATIEPLVNKLEAKKGE